MQSSPERVQFVPFLLRCIWWKGSCCLPLVKGLTPPSLAGEQLPAPSAAISPASRAKYEGGTECSAFRQGDRHRSHHQPDTGRIFKARDKVKSQDKGKWRCADSHPSPKELHTPKELLMLGGCRSHLPPAPSAIGFAATPTLDANLFLAALLPAAC